MILTASRKIRGVGILCAGGRWRRLAPFAGQAGFVAEDVDADPDRHPHATPGTSLSPRGLVRFVGRVEAARVRTRRPGPGQSRSGMSASPQAESGECDWPLSTLLEVGHQIVTRSGRFYAT